MLTALKKTVPAVRVPSVIHNAVIRNRNARGLAVAALLTALPAAAETDDVCREFLGAVSFNVGVPQGELRDQIEDDAFGIAGQIFYAPGPVGIGLDVAYLNYGSETRREPFSTTIPDVTVDVETTNNVVQAFLVLRGQMPDGPVRLYGDALFGFNYLFTETSIQDTDGGLTDIASTTQQDDGAFAYGGGGGVMIPVHRSDDPDCPGEVLLDVGVRYIAGGEAEYLKEGSIRLTGGEVEFDKLQSRTDLVRFHAGVAFRW